jgi:CHASE3 domain sensor protein
MRQGTRLVAGVLVAAATGGAAVALGVALLLGNIVHLRSSANATLRTGAYLEATINLESLVVDAETGLRGYVITGRSLFLAPERAAVAQMPAAAAGLERAAANDGEFVPLARALGQSAGSYLASYVPEVIRDVTSDPTAARSYPTTAEGKALVDGIRTQTARLEQLISSRQNARQRAARDSANAAVSVAVVALVVLTLLTVALVGILGWLLVGRERARVRAEALYRASEGTATTLQQSLLPTEIPEIPSCELAIRFAPAGAGELVGGDFYDVFALDDGQWAIVIGDVCGKGPEAAAVTAMARWTLRTLAGGEPTAPVDVLRRLNDAMLRHDLSGRFMTLVYALVEVGDDEARVSLACAGHPPAIVVSDTGEPMPVTASGDLLGVWPEIRLRQSEFRLAPGGALVLYTDGVTDQGPGAERSAERTLGRVHTERTADALADALLDEAGRWTEGARDDVAIVALRYLPTEERIAPRGLTGAAAGA